MNPRRVIFLSSLGGAFELYDFVVYMALTPYLSLLFFPTLDSFNATIRTFGVFAIGYLVRPFGGMIFGHLGDRLGRKKMFVASILCMSIPVFLLGLLPTHETIGRLAPILLVLLRTIQGIAVGGEVPGAMTFTCEYVDPKKRGLAGGSIYCGIDSGIALATLVLAILTTVLSKEQILAFGWRIPFIFGALFGFLAVYLRSQVSESPLFLKLQKENKLAKQPIKTLLHKHLRSVVIGILITATGSSATILCFSYINDYLTTELHYNVSFASWLVFASTVLSAVLQILFGHLSDLWGRARLLSIGVILMAICAVPIFYWLAFPSPIIQIIAMIVLAVLAAVIIGVFATFLIELFPTAVRYSGYGISYNIGFAIFGGLAPSATTRLIHLTHSLLVPGFILIITSLLALIGIIWARNKQLDGQTALS